MINIASLAEVFINLVIKHYSFVNLIVSNKNTIFMLKFELFLY